MGKYPFFKQEEAKDCAAACLYMIIEYYHGHLSMEKIRNLLNVNHQGTTAYHIVEGAKKIGFEAKGVKCNFDDINEDNLILPCIANVVVNNTYRHFIVIYKINFIKRKILIADPSNKIITMSFDIFKTIFSGVIIMLYPKDNIPCENKKNLKIVLISYIINSHPKLILQVSILSFFITLFSIFSSLFLQNISNIISSYKTNDIVILSILIFLLVNFLKCLSKFFRYKILALINEKINLKFSLDTFQRILLLPYKTYRNKTTGDILTRLLDVNVIKDTSSKIFLTLLVDLPLSILATILLFIINERLFILSLIIFVLYVLSILIFKELFELYINKVKKDNIEVTNYMIESVNNFETVKGLKIFDNIYHQFEKRFVKMLKSSFKYENIIYLQNFVKEIINECGLILIYGIGAILVIDKQIDFPSLLTFGALLNYFFEPLQSLADLQNDTKELDLVLNRLSELEYLSTGSGIITDTCKGKIEFKNLTYSYDEKVDVLKNINLKINQGEKVVILGQSGTGKSTLVKIILKYYEVTRGTLFIDDIDINDYIDTKGIIYVSQNENLFTDSLYNNLTLYQKVSSNRLMNVCKICELEDVVSKNSLGYNMMIEENGFNISGGEKQRIILARTILNFFNILIIDEGLNQVDVNTERKILKNLFSKYTNKTIIVISHRLENLDLFDKKITLENGEIK